jgi:predicted nicotinamide N-methyase
MLCQRCGVREARCLVTSCDGNECYELYLCLPCRVGGGGLLEESAQETAWDRDGEPLDRMIVENTVIRSAPLVPEISVRLLRHDSPLWRAFEDQPEAAELARPYWAFAWSGGQALARYLLDRPAMARGKRVLDFGAGCGIAGIAAARAGAHEVIASDIDPVSVRAIRHNAELNSVQVETVQGDLIYAENPGWDVLLAGDIWYESRLARHGLSWLRALAEAGVIVLVGDPGRAFSPSHGIESLATYSCRSVPDLEHPALQTVSVFQILSGDPEKEPAQSLPQRRKTGAPTTRSRRTGSLPNVSLPSKRSGRFE